jgi:sortase (surface protein transpeptidase)
VHVVAQRGQEELSLTTCHPPGSAERRLVVQARALSFDAGAGQYDVRVETGSLVE